AVGSGIPELVVVDASGPDHKGLRAVRVGLTGGVLRREALIEVVVALQDDVDVLGHEELDPGLDAGLRAVLADAGEVRLVPVGDRASVRVGVEVPLQPGRDLVYSAAVGPGTGVWKRHEVPASFVKGVRRVRSKGHGAPVAMRAAPVEVLQRIGILPEP